MKRVLVIILFTLFISSCKNAVIGSEMKGRYMNRNTYIKYCDRKDCIQAYYNGVADLCLDILHSPMFQAIVEQEAAKYSEDPNEYIWKECNTVVVNWYFDDRYHKNRRGK